MELAIVACFHALPARRSLSRVILETLVPARVEASVAVLPLDRDERLFFIHPCWVDEAPFGCPAGEPRSRRSR